MARTRTPPKKEAAFNKEKNRSKGKWITPLLPYFEVLLWIMLQSKYFKTLEDFLIARNWKMGQNQVHPDKIERLGQYILVCLSITKKEIHAKYNAAMEFVKEQIIEHDEKKKKKRSKDFIKHLCDYIAANKEGVLTTIHSRLDDSLEEMKKQVLNGFNTRLAKFGDNASTDVGKLVCYVNTSNKKPRHEACKTTPKSAEHPKSSESAKDDSTPSKSFDLVDSSPHANQISEPDATKTKKKKKKKVD